MKLKNILYSLMLAGFCLSFTACETDEPDESVSVITIDKYEPNPFDLWLEENFVAPYNIAFKYRYEQIESDLNYYTVPANLEESIILAHLVKYTCCDLYDEVAGVEFTRSYFPKMFFLIGEWEYKNNGTIILGTAEGGKKILLSGVNHLKSYMSRGADAVNYYYLKTIHHEFTHILNQTVTIPNEYKFITGEGYVEDLWSESPYDEGYLTRGFISAYSQNSYTEDFAEMLSMYITNTPEQWAAWLEQAGDASDLIEAKLDIVRSYMQSGFGIDIDELRSALMRRQNEIFTGKVDLEDISLKSSNQPNEEVEE